MEQTFSNTSLWNEFLCLSIIHLMFLFKKRMSFFISSSKAKKWFLLIFEIQCPMLFSCLLSIKKISIVTTENKIDNPVFVDDEDIPIIHQDEDYYDDYRTPDTSRVDDRSFTVPDTAAGTSALRLRQKVKRDKQAALYRHLNITGNLDLINLNRFKLTTNPKKGAAIFDLQR